MIARVRLFVQTPNIRPPVQAFRGDSEHALCLLVCIRVCWCTLARMYHTSVRSTHPCATMHACSLWSHTCPIIHTHAPAICSLVYLIFVRLWVFMFCWFVAIRIHAPPCRHSGLRVCVYTVGCACWCICVCYWWCVLFLFALADNNNIGPDGMSHLSSALIKNSTLTSLEIEGTCVLCSFYVFVRVHSV